MGIEDLAWSEKQRLTFIERVLYWKGAINRRDLCLHFGISMPQATNDLVNYTTRNPGACAYNVRAKCYQANPGMEPWLMVPDFEADIEAMGGVGYPDGVEGFVARPEQPGRPAKPEIFQALTRAAHARQAVDVFYYSLQSGTQGWRRLSPRTFANDGLRWHVRAWCHQREAFRDFALSRISKVRAAGPCPCPERVDEAWHRQVKLVIRVAPGQTAIQRRALEIDYQMKDGECTFMVRKALLLYAQRRLGFVDVEKKELPVLNERKELVLASQAMADGALRAR